MSNKGKDSKVQPGESFADAVREGTSSSETPDHNARLKPGETYADAVAEGGPSSEDAPPAYSANNAKGSSAQSQSSGGKGYALHLPNSHHARSPSPGDRSAGHGGHGASAGASSHPHSHHLSTQRGGHGHPQHGAPVAGGGGLFAFAAFGGGPDGAEEDVVMVPEREYIYAIMRARRRFWATVFWALLIYIVAGAIVGGGVADANSHRGKHKKGGKWHDYAIGGSTEEGKGDGERLAFVRAGVPVDRKEEIEMPWDYRVQDVSAPE